MDRHCIAYVEEVLKLNSRRSCWKYVMRPCCGGKQKGKLFCRQHEKAYREILLGILLYGPRPRD